MADQTPAKTSSPILIAAAWAIVIVPTAWGLNYTVQNAMKILQKPAATAPAAAQSR
jgi:hypothetical protein